MTSDVRGILAVNDVPREPRLPFLFDKERYRFRLICFHIRNNETICARTVFICQVYISFTNILETWRCELFTYWLIVSMALCLMFIIFCSISKSTLWPTLKSFVCATFLSDSGISVPPTKQNKNKQTKNKQHKREKNRIVIHLNLHLPPRSCRRGTGK